MNKSQGHFICLICNICRVIVQSPNLQTELKIVVASWQLLKICHTSPLLFLTIPTEAVSNGVMSSAFFNLLFGNNWWEFIILQLERCGQSTGNSLKWMYTVKQNRVRAWRCGCDIIINKNFWELKPGGDAKCEQRPFLSPFTIPDCEAVRKIAWELIPGG